MNEYNQTEIGLKIQRTNVVTNGEREEERGKIGVGDKELQTPMYKINKLQGYIVQHREIFYNNFKWSIIYKNCESCCTPKTSIIL